LLWPCDTWRIWPAQTFIPAECAGFPSRNALFPADIAHKSASSAAFLADAAVFPGDCLKESAGNGLEPAGNGVKPWEYARKSAGNVVNLGANLPFLWGRDVVVLLNAMLSPVKQPPTMATCGLTQGSFGFAGGR